MKYLLIILFILMFTSPSSAQDVLFEPGDEIKCAVWNEEKTEYTTAFVCRPKEEVWLEVEVNKLHEEVKIFYLVEVASKWQPYVADVVGNRYNFPKPHNRFRDVYVLAWPELKVPVDKLGVSVLKARY